MMSFFTEISLEETIDICMNALLKNLKYWKVYKYKI